MSSMPWLAAREKTVTVMDANPDGSMAENMPISEEEIMAAEDVISALNMKDARRLAMAMKAAFQMFDSEPHVEGEHIE